MVSGTQQASLYVENPILTYYKNASTAASALLEEETKEDHTANRSSSRRGYIEQELYLAQQEGSPQVVENEYDQITNKRNNTSLLKGSVTSFQSVNHTNNSMQQQLMIPDQHLDYSNRGLKSYEIQDKTKTKPKSLTIAFNEIKSLAKPTALH